MKCVPLFCLLFGLMISASLLPVMAAGTAGAADSDVKLRGKLGPEGKTSSNNATSAPDPVEEALRPSGGADSRTRFTSPDDVLSANPIKLTVTKDDLSSELPRLTEPLGLDRAVQVGLKNNLRFLASDYNWRSSKFLARAALAEFGPRTSLSLMYSESSISQMLFFMQRDISPAPMQPIVRGQSLHLLFAGYQPLFTGGRILGNYRASRALEKQSLAEYQSDRILAALRVKEQYWKAAWNLAKLQVAEDYVKYRQWSVKLMSDRYKQGKVPKADLLREEAELAKAKQEVNQGYRDFNVALLDLKVAMGVNVGSQISLRDSLRFNVIKRPYNFYLQEAQYHRPEIMAAAQKVKEEKGRYEVARSKYMPQIGAYGVVTNATGRTPGVSGSVDGQWGGMISVIGGVTLFDSGKRFNELRSARARIRAAQIAQRDVHLNVARDVSQAWIDLDMARRNVQLATDEVTSAREDERLFFRRYEVGKSIELDYFVSGVRLFEARLHLLEAIYNYRLAEARLIWSSGKV